MSPAGLHIEIKPAWNRLLGGQSWLFSAMSVPNQLGSTMNGPALLLPENQANARRIVPHLFTALFG
jgi:hypothetical protein